MWTFPLVRFDIKLNSTRERLTVSLNERSPSLSTGEIRSAKNAITTTTRHAYTFRKHPMSVDCH